MSAPVVARIRRNTDQTINETFAELWSAGDLAALVGEAEQAIADCLDYPTKAEALYHAGWRAAIPAIQQKQPIDWYGRGLLLQEQFESSMAVLQTLRKWACDLEKAGQIIANRAQLDDAIAQMKRVRTRLEEHWPWPMTAQEWAEAEEEIARGEGCSLEEAFAEAAGVSVEEWLRRVEEHKRQHGL